MDIVERLRTNGLANEAADEIEQLRDELDFQLHKRKEETDEIERLREALRNVLSVQPIKGDEGSAHIISLAKSLLRIDRIARDALKEKK